MQPDGALGCRCTQQQGLQFGSELQLLLLLLNAPDLALGAAALAAMHVSIQTACTVRRTFALKLHFVRLHTQELSSHDPQQPVEGGGSCRTLLACAAESEHALTTCRAISCNPW
jgi:hypothetical protein